MTVPRQRGARPAVPPPRDARRRRPGPLAAGLAALASVPLASVPLAGCGTPPQPERIARVEAVPAPGPSALAGGLVPGFPGVVPVPADAHVTASAVRAHGDTLAVSVTGTSRRPVAELLAWFRARLRAEGFTATDDSLLPRGASGAAYGRPGGVELLIVAVVDRGEERSWSVGGTVQPERRRS